MLDLEEIEKRYGLDDKVNASIVRQDFADLIAEVRRLRNNPVPVPPRGPDHIDFYK